MVAARIRRTLPLALAVAVPCLLAGCAERLGHRSAGTVAGSIKVPGGMAANGGPRVQILGQDGHLTVQPGEPGEIRWEGVRRIAADTPVILAQIEALEPTLELVPGEPVDPAAEDPALVLRATPIPAEVDPAAAIVALELVVYVPPDLDLEVRLMNGNPSAWDRSGAVDLATKRGDVLLRNCTGPAELFTRSGKVLVVNHRADLQVEVGAGDIQADIGALGPAGASLTIASGPVRCSLPPDAACEVDAFTDIGRSIRPEQAYPEVEVFGEGYSSGMRGRIGAGGPLLKIRGGSSNVSIAPQVER